MAKEKSAGAVVFRRDGNKIYYLLLEHNEKYFNFPKGHVERGETEERAAIREITEETGLKDIKIIKGFRGINKYYFRREDKTIFKTVVFYLAETETKEIKISHEHTGFKWLLYNEALNQLKFKIAKAILKKANDFIIGTSFSSFLPPRPLG